MKYRGGGLGFDGTVEVVGMRLWWLWRREVVKKSWISARHMELFGVIGIGA